MKKGTAGLGDPRSLLPYGAPDWNRTSDLWYRKPTLYPLSYGGGPVKISTVERSSLTRGAAVGLSRRPPRGIRITRRR